MPLYHNGWGTPGQTIMGEGAVGPNVVVADDWATLLRASCEVLHGSTAITAVSVTESPGGLDEARRLLMFSQRIAEEYGFQEQVRLEGDYVTVRFSRRCFEWNGAGQV